MAANIFHDKLRLNKFIGTATGLWWRLGGLIFISGLIEKNILHLLSKFCREFSNITGQILKNLDKLK